MNKFRYILLGNDYKAKKKYISMIAKKHNIELRILNELQLRTKDMRSNNLILTKDIFGTRIGYVFEYFDLYRKNVRAEISKFIKYCDFDIFVLSKDISKLIKLTKNVEEKFEIKEFRKPIDTKKMGKISLEILTRKYVSPMDKLQKVQEHKSLVLSRIDKRMTPPMIFAAAIVVIENIEVE